MERAGLTALLKTTGCAAEIGGFTFLCDPSWSATQRADFSSRTSNLERRKSNIESGWVCIATGGTSGGLRFARHDEQTLGAAARGFSAHFGIERVNAVDVLPPHHVSGLMSRVRCASTGGSHLAWGWKQLEAGEHPTLSSARDGWVISLVPTQLQRLLASTDAVRWLKNFRVIFIGGGPVWPDLAAKAADAGLPISLSYGMTETAAMVTALRPEEFLAGERSCGAALPHARIAVNADGVVVVSGESVFRGYFPEEKTSREFETEDLGRIDDRGHLQIFGRRDAVVITGGKKVNPVEVEASLRGSGEFADVAVLGVNDPEWGQAVVAFYPDSGGAPNIARASAGLAPHQRPKRFVAVTAADWPRSAQGKVNRAALLRLVR